MRSRNLTKDDVMRIAIAKTPPVDNLSRSTGWCRWLTGRSYERTVPADDVDVRVPAGILTISMYQLYTHNFIRHQRQQQ